jgi:hypothetical protein
LHRWNQHSPLVSKSLHEEIKVALQVSKKMWNYQQALSKEARTAVKAIIFVLDRAQVSQYS